MSERDRPVQRTRLEDASLHSAWEEHAEAFIAWARKPGHDSYWQYHRDQFLELLPPPGRRTLDLGCGEGRLARDLTALGHSLVGVDASPTMIAAARDADADLELHVADAASLPLAAGSFDLVVAFMSLQDVEDYRGAIAEAARVLDPGGRLCFAIVHPLNSAGTFELADDADSPFVIRGSYLESSYYRDAVLRDGLEIEFVSAHRPVQSYADALADAGFLIERLHETGIPQSAVRHPRSRRWQRLPLFLHVRALKPDR